MKTKTYNTDERVTSILEKAVKQYEELTGIWGLTSDFLLKTVLLDSGADNELLMYLVMNNLFRLFYLKYNEKLNLSYEETLKKHFEFFKQKIDQDYRNFAGISEETLLNYYIEVSDTNSKKGIYINKELTYDLTSDSNDEERYSVEVKAILDYAEKISLRANGRSNQIDLNALLVSLVQEPNYIWRYLFEEESTSNLEEIQYYIEFDRLKEVFSEKNYVQSRLHNWRTSVFKQDMDVKLLTTTLNSTDEIFQQSELDEIVEDAPDYLKLLCPEFTKDSEYTILGRDREIKKAFFILQKMTCKNIIFTGPGGIGKTAMFEGIQERLIKGECPEALKGKIILYLDINIFLSNTKYVGQSQEKFAELSEYLETHPKVILAIDEIHGIVGAGRGSKSSHDFANALKPLLTSGKTSIIGATTTKEYRQWIEPDEPLKRRFARIEISEPKDEQLWAMLQGKKDVLEKFHGVSVWRESFEYIISQAAAFDFYIPKPARIIELLDNSMVIAKENGKKVLDKESIDEANIESMERYKSFKKNYPKELLSTAYHEIGHFILQQKYLREFKDVSVVSIIPSKGYWGINVFEHKDTILPITREVIVQNIAEWLAGNKAEMIFGYSNNAGKTSDLKAAYVYAKSAILNKGLIDTNGTLLGQYIYISPDSKLEELSDSQKECLSQEISALMKEGENLAEEVLEAEKDKLELLARELFDKGALTKTQLEALYNQEKPLEMLEEI